MNCPNCGNVVQEDALFCDQCGARLGGAVAVPAQETAATPAPAAPVAAHVSAVSLCPGCGAENLPGELFCAECGTPLEAPEPLRAAPAAAAAQATPSAPDGAPAYPTQSEPETLACAACGAEVRPDDAFCFACGARLADQRAAPAAVAQAGQETVVAPDAAVQAARAPDVCPSCGAKARPGDLFCDFCGAALGAAAAAPAFGTTAAVPAQPAPGQAEQPYLVVVASGIEIPLAQGTEVLVGREDPYSGVFPDVDLTPHGGEEAGVSRRHFKLTLAEGRYAIQDLGSTNYTWVNQQRLEVGTPVAIKNGDQIRAGRLKLVFRTRP